MWVTGRRLRPLRAIPEAMVQARMAIPVAMVRPSAGGGGPDGSDGGRAPQDQRGQERAGCEPTFDPVEFPPPRLRVLAGQGHVPAGERQAAAVLGEIFASTAPCLLAESLRRVVDAGDVGAGIDAGIVALHDPQKSVLGERELSLELGACAEVLEPCCGFLSCRALEVGVLVGLDLFGVELSAGERLLAFHLRSEAGITGA